MIGKSGHGKSTTGNGILRRKAFPVSHFSESETSESKYASTTQKNKTFVSLTHRVYSIQETSRLRGAKSKKITLELIRACALLFPGFHAIIFVMKAGERYTHENKKAVAIYQQLFGDEV